MHQFAPNLPHQNLLEHRNYYTMKLYSFSITQNKLYNW